MALAVMLAFGVAAWAASWPGWPAGGRVQASAKHGKKRLILKDGSSLDVVRFHVRDGQVRYQRAQGEAWQEIPAAQVDWKATKEWARTHPHGVTGEAREFENLSPAEAQRQIEEIDREEQAQRATVRDLMPVVKPGLRLPDEDGVFALDEYKGQPELVHLRQADGDLNQNPFHSVQGVDVDRMHGFAEVVRMEGVRAAVQMHVGRPVFYVSVRGGALVAPAGAFVVDEKAGSTDGAPVGGGSASSHFVLVKVVRQGEARVIYAMQLRDAAVPDASGRRIETVKTLIAGGHWMKLTPAEALEPGEYALVEVLGPREVNRDVWDFGVHSGAPENQGARLPVKAGR
jgi:hypothetical protein